MFCVEVNVSSIKWFVTCVAEEEDTRERSWSPHTIGLRQNLCLNAMIHDRKSEKVRFTGVQSINVSEVAATIVAKARKANQVDLPL